jgi:hypothetical protein
MSYLWISGDTPAVQKFIFCNSLLLTWIQKQQERLLKTRYFHLVVTLPHEFNEIIRSNQRKMYFLLLHTAFHAVNKVIQRKVCDNALVGAIAVLHTWPRAFLPFRGWYG